MSNTAWLTKKEVASYLKRSTRTIDKWIKADFMPKGIYKMGRPYWSAQQLDKWMMKNISPKEPANKNLQ